MSNYHHPYIHINDGPEDMECCETGAVEGLLKLQQASSSQVSLISCSNSITPSVSSSTHLLLNPIHPLQQQQYQEYRRLPSLSNLLLPHNIEVDFYHYSNNSSCSSTANLLYSPSITDDNSSIYSYYPASSSQHQPSLIPPLSTSTSFSSLRSCASSIKSSNQQQQQKGSLLSRAATFTSRRRGRPRKSTIISTEVKNEFKIVDMSSYNYGSGSSECHKDVTATGTASPTMNKPRWQEAERLDLLEAIVKEKNLDDMTSIRWDRISLAVGRAKKACKDQWRREVLPNLMRGLRSNNGSSNKKKGNSTMDH